MITEIDVKINNNNFDDNNVNLIFKLSLIFEFLSCL